jgi:hypothetical protein
MKHVINRGVAIHVETKTRSPWVDEWDQPWSDYLRYLALETLDTLLWWRPLKPLTLRVERFFRVRHDRRDVHDDCLGTFYKTVGPPGGRSQDEDDPGVEMCVYMPLTNRLDCRLFELSRKNIQNYNRITP